MLNKDEIMIRYGRVRQYTARFSGQDIMDVEDCVKEIAASHVEALEEIKHLKEGKDY
jgi:hypothetical protein